MQMCDVVEFKVTCVFRKDIRCTYKLTNLDIKNRIELRSIPRPDCIRLYFFHNNFELL